MTKHGHRLLNRLGWQQTPIGPIWLDNPTNPVLADTLSRDLEAAARAIGQQIHVVSAGTERDFDTAFTKLVQQGVGALVVGNDPLFNSRPDRLVARAGVSICSD